MSTLKFTHKKAPGLFVEVTVQGICVCVFELRTNAGALVLTQKVKTTMYKNVRRIARRMLRDAAKRRTLPAPDVSQAGPSEQARDAVAAAVLELAKRGAPFSTAEQIAQLLDGNVCMARAAVNDELARADARVCAASNAALSAHRVYRPSYSALLAALRA